MQWSRTIAQGERKLTCLYKVCLYLIITPEILLRYVLDKLKQVKGIHSGYHQRALADIGVWKQMTFITETSCLETNISVKA